MHIKDLAGKFNITGTNQDEVGGTYKGILELELDQNNRIVANWTNRRKSKPIWYRFL